MNRKIYFKARGKEIEIKNRKPKMVKVTLIRGEKDEEEN